MQDDPNDNIDSSFIQSSPAPQTIRASSLVDTEKHRQSHGRIFRARGAPSYRGETYFGLHSAASIMDGMTPDLPPGVDIGRSRGTLGGTSQPFRSERGPYALM